MKNIKDNLKRLRHLSLSEKEKLSVWSNLKAYAEFKPIADERIGKRTRLPSVKPTNGFPLFLKLKPMSFIASLLIVSLFGGGTAFAAEGAVPGDILYPIKTDITENVRGAFALDNEAQATFEAWRAERRLNEAAKLVQKGSLSADAKEKIETKFSEHSDRVEDRLVKIAEKNPALAAELSARFEASLHAHEAILENLEDRFESEDDGIKTSVRIREREDSVAKIRIRTVGALTASTTSDAAHEAQKNAALRLEAVSQKALTRATLALEAASSTLTAEAKIRFDTALANAQASHEAGTSARDAENYRGAVIAFEQSLRASFTLSAALTANDRARVRLKIDDHEFELEVKTENDHSSQNESDDSNDTDDTRSGSSHDSDDDDEADDDDSRQRGTGDSELDEHIQIDVRL